MDTKWKSRLLFAGWLLLFVIGLSSVVAAVHDGRTYFKRDYFHTMEFDDHLNQFISYLNTYELGNMSKEEAKKAITVTAEEIEEHRYRYGSLPEQIANIKSQYETAIQEANAADNKEAAQILIKERDKKIADITKNFQDEEYVRQKVRVEKEQAIDDYYQSLEEERSNFEDYQAFFKYYFKDTSTGKVYTNVNMAGSSVKEIFNQKNMLFIQKYEAANALRTGEQTIGYGESGEGILLKARGGKFEGRIGAVSRPTAASPLYNDYKMFQQNQKVFIIYVASGFILLLISLYIGKRFFIFPSGLIEKIQPLYNRVPLDVSIAAALVTWLLTIVSLQWSNVLIYYEYTYTLIQNVISHLLASLCLTFLSLLQGKLLVKRWKAGEGIREEWRQSVIAKLGRLLANAFLVRSIGIQLFLLLAVFFFTGFGVPIAVSHLDLLAIYGVLFLFISLPALILLFRGMAYLNLIIQHTGRLAAGHLEADLPVRGRSVFAKMAEHINVLKKDVKASQREQAKSERLKTELITNVSHDLRTPLTSIISYTELLKNETISAEERIAYTEIIDRKSKRLKGLIDDLFEASKMASGNAELVKEKVDLVQLLQQALGEYDEAIGESSLQFRVTNPDEPVFAMVDGQKIWRVFDNLIGNILKYSLENTRVYISIKTMSDQAIITFKNVTKYELGDNVDEMFERFKRGDRSRHTEGSGLGLAIAKSIIDLHEGTLDIEVDGDLFKVTVALHVSS
ncbi:histidine kinase [Bacillus sp. FJAT-27231]|uniref:sensor histidine kinase n=1 Tax=Bacillus sp. FJAT-27231 TaxID=1679168 RepID=UPI0006716788|nr:HAMP domain-containing sensor histidine kinase [Bacillus sp. FJAT-27231]KMY55770.1 histidine kinase [Bacillus sp. FJAT-27231]